MLITFIIKGRCWHICIGGLGSVINTKPINISVLWHPAQPLPHALVLLSWKWLKADLGKQLKANLGNSVTYRKWKWSFKTTQTILVFPITFDLLARASHGSAWTDRDQNNLSSAQTSAPSPAKHPPCPPTASPLLGQGVAHQSGPGALALAVVLQSRGGGLGAAPDSWFGQPSPTGSNQEARHPSSDSASGAQLFLHLSGDVF